MSLVCELASVRHQPPPAVRELVPHRHDLDVRDRLAELVDDAPGDDAAVWQREVDAFDRLRVENLERLARFERPRLPVLQPDVTAFACIERVSAGRKILELVGALRVGRGEALLAKLRRKRADLRLAQRLTAVGREHVPANPGGPGLRAACRAQGIPGPPGNLDRRPAGRDLHREDLNRLLRRGGRRDQKKPEDTGQCARHTEPLGGS